MAKFIRSWIPLAIVVTGMCGLVCLAVQQDIRSSANDPQIQMAEDAALRLSSGDAPVSVVPRGTMIDISKSIAPFISVFDDSGLQLESTAVLDGKTVKPPAGVFDYARKNGEDRITWQPRNDIRDAIVLVHYGGKNPGFVLAGRSLRDSEERVARLNLETGLAWLLTLMILFIYFAIFS